VGMAPKSKWGVRAHPCTRAFSTFLPTNFNIFYLNHHTMRTPETSSSIEAAIADHARRPRASVRSLARKWGVPESSLRDKIKGRPTRRVARATQQLLPPTQEFFLANWILEQEACG
jgi:hypothetical protein